VLKGLWARLRPTFNLYVLGISPSTQLSKAEIMRRYWDVPEESRPIVLKVANFDFADRTGSIDQAYDKVSTILTAVTFAFSFYISRTAGQMGMLTWVVKWMMICSMILLAWSLMPKFKIWQRRKASPAGHTEEKGRDLTIISPAERALAVTSEAGLFYYLTEWTEHRDWLIHAARRLQNSGICLFVVGLPVTPFGGLGCPLSQGHPNKNLSQPMIK